MLEPEVDNHESPARVDSPSVVGSLLALLAAYEVVAFTVNRVLDEPVLPSSFGALSQVLRASQHGVGVLVRFFFDRG